MKLVIAGSRYGHFTLDDVRNAISRNIEGPVTLVISGTATGVDRLGELWALENDIPVKLMPAEWHIHGRRAGFIRNEQMAEEADVVLCLWDGQSAGTRHMIAAAKVRNIPTYVYP